MIGWSRCVSKKEDILKMVSWVPIIAVGDGEGQWRKKGVKADDPGCRP